LQQVPEQHEPPQQSPGQSETQLPFTQLSQSPHPPLQALLSDETTHKTKQNNMNVKILYRFKIIN
jgi:hypothetical protein